MRYRKKLVK